MKLVSVRHGAHRGLPERELNLAAGGQPHPLVAIAGPSGCGKTTLLDLIVLHKEHVAPYGRPTSALEVLVGTQEQLLVETTWLLNEKEIEETGSANEQLTARSIFRRGRSESHVDPALEYVLSRYRHEWGWGKVDYVPEGRVAPPKTGPSGDPVAWQKKQRLGRDGAKYAGLSRLYLTAIEEEQQAARELFSTLRPGLSFDVDIRGGLGFETPHGKRTYGALSLSQRIAFDLALTFALVGLHESVVLIDTPELGVPAGDALGMLVALREFAPTTQLIATTNDPQILTSGAAVIRLEES